ncbi:ATP-binding protein [Bdellovibrionota bacterium FG-1]
MSAKEKIKALLIDEDENDFFLLRELLAEIGNRHISIEWAAGYPEGLSAMVDRKHDVYLANYRLGSRTGIELLDEALSLGCKAPLILLTGVGDEGIDRKAIEIGAADYLVKGQISAHLLERSLRYSVYRAQSLEALRQREESFRSLLNSTFEGIIVHRDNGTIFDVNQAATTLFGSTRSRMRGTNLFSYCSEQARAKLLLLTAMDKEASGEILDLRKDGKPISVDVSSKPYIYQGTPARLTSIRDIGNRKETEGKLLLQDRLASVGLLASSLAHEIGTPLGVIRGRAEYLGMQASENPSVQKNVAVIISQIDRVSKLIRSLLNLARGDNTGTVGSVSLSQSVSDVLDLMAHEFRKKAVLIDNQLPPPPGLLVKGVSEALHQVILNLLVNSSHAIGTAIENGRHLEHFVRITLEDQGKQVVMAISDSGCGISTANMKNLFKPFFTTKDIGVGTGLGLATSYKIIESWGGNISAESRENAGTTFKIALTKAQIKK